MFVNKKMFLLFNIVLFILEVGLIYLMIISFLTKDLVGPSEMNLEKYLKVKTSNIVMKE